MFRQKAIPSTKHPAVLAPICVAGGNWSIGFLEFFLSSLLYALNK